MGYKNIPLFIREELSATAIGKIHFFCDTAAFDKKTGNKALAGG